jgi:hypothetical protein
MPPIYRLTAWWRHRQTLCTVCRKHPKVTWADGENRYCSIECAQEDREQQAHFG